MSNSNSIGLQTFNTAFPLDFVLQNQNQGADLSVLYIVDNVDDKASSQQIKVVISTNNEESHNFKGFGFNPPGTPTIPSSGSSSAQLVPSNAPITPTDSQYNLAIAVRPGTLRAAVQENFAISLYKGITASLEASASLESANTCVVNGPITRSSDGALVWYVTFQNDIKTGWQKVSSWPTVANSISGASGVSIANICVLNDGSLFGVGSDNNYYEQADVSSGVWTHPTGAPQGLSMAIQPDGNFIAVGTGNHMWKVPAPPTSSGVMITGSGAVTNAFVLADNSIIGIGMGHELWHFEWTGETSGSWGSSAVEESLYNNEPFLMTQVVALPNGQLLAIGKADGYLYVKESWSKGNWALLDGSVALQAIGVKADGKLLLYGTDNKMYIQQAAVTFSFMLEGISAAAGTGTRSSQIELLFGNVSVNASSNLMSFKRSAHVDIINHEGHSYAPLYFGVLGDNTLLNGTTKPNDLSIYFETTNGKPIQLGPDESPTKIDFSFSYTPDDGDMDLMTFGGKSEVAAFQLSTSEKYPFDTSGVAVDDGDGNYQLSAEFKNLASIQAANTPDNATAKANSLTAYQKPANTTNDLWTTHINNADKYANTIAKIITTGPLKNLKNQDYTEPSIKGWACNFETLWKEQIQENTQNDNQFGGAWDTAITSSTVTGFTPKAYNQLDPWTDKNFLLYVVSNYNELTAKLKASNSSAVVEYSEDGNGPTKVDNQTVYEIYPCEATFQFFWVYYDLEKKLEQTLQNPPTGIGPKELASRFIRVNQFQLMMQNIQSIIQLGEYYTAPQGPLVQYYVYENFDEGEGSYTMQNIYNHEQGIGTTYFTSVLGNNGSQLQLSASTWQNNYGELSVPEANGYIWDTLPSGATFTPTVSNPWTTQLGAKVLTHVNKHLNLLFAQFATAASLRVQDYEYDDDSSYPFIPSKVLAAFFYQQYNFSQLLEKDPANFMLDISQPISKTSWDIAFSQAVQAIPTGNTVLTQSKMNNHSQNWSTAFTTFLNDKGSGKNHSRYVDLTTAIGTITPENSSSQFVVPCQNLYDYLYSDYQAWLTAHHEGDNVPTPNLYRCTSYVFPFSNLLTSGSDGVVTLNIKVQNLPGYWDTTFQLPIRKSKSILDPTLKLGHSGQHGRIRILPTDPNYNNNGLNPGSRIDFLSGKTTSGKANVSIEEYYGLNLIGGQPDSGTVNAATEADNTNGFNKTGQPVRVKDADFLVQDGRVGIGNVPHGYLSGDFSNASDSDPNEKLRVVGNTYLNGQITANSDIKTDGNLSVSGNTSMEGNVKIQGNVQLQGALTVKNPIVPVGTIIQMLTRSSLNNKPKGWLVCDGTSLLTDHILANNSINLEYIPLLIYLMNGRDFYTSNGGPVQPLSYTTTTIKKQGSKYYLFDPTWKPNHQYSDESLDSMTCTLPNLSQKTLQANQQASVQNESGGNNWSYLNYLIKYTL